MSKPIEYPKIASLVIGEWNIGAINHIEEIVFDDDSKDKIRDKIRVLPSFKDSIPPNLPTFSFSHTYNSEQAKFLDILFANRKRLPRKLKKAYNRVQKYIQGFTFDVSTKNGKIEPDFGHQIKGRLEAKAKRLIIAEYSKYTCRLK